MVGLQYYSSPGDTCDSINVDIGRVLGVDNGVSCSDGVLPADTPVCITDSPNQVLMPSSWRVFSESRVPETQVTTVYIWVFTRPRTLVQSRVDSETMKSALFLRLPVPLVYQHRENMFASKHLCEAGERPLCAMSSVSIGWFLTGVGRVVRSVPRAPLLASPSAAPCRTCWAAPPTTASSSVTLRCGAATLCAATSP